VDLHPAMHRFQVERFGEHFADRELAADILHVAVVADIELGRLERRGEGERLAAPLHPAMRRAGDALLERAPGAAEVRRIVGQRIDVVLALDAGHARQVHVLDHLQVALEQLDPHAKAIQAEVRRLQQHHQLARRHGAEGRQHRIRRHGVEVDEGRLRQVAAIAFEQRARQAGAGVVHHQCALRRAMFERDRQHVMQMSCGGIDGVRGKVVVGIGSGHGGIGKCNKNVERQAAIIRRSDESSRPGRP